MNPELKNIIERETGSEIKRSVPVGGGCISNAEVIKLSDGSEYFLKSNLSSPNDMFEKEAHGLKELALANVIRVPNVIFLGKSFILLEFIKTSSPDKNFFKNFGMRFAKLHRHTSDTFGFYEDNFIGATIQKNIPEKSELNNWTEFYLNKRLLPQIRLAEENGYLTDELKVSFNKLTDKIDSIIQAEEPPVLLHGDLWSGNFIVSENSEPCLIDPAVYYGSREADLAMTKLFGGFSQEFYSAYNEEYPLLEGYSYRENIYKLYHVLNHLNLFGSAYYSQALKLIRFYM